MKPEGHLNSYEQFSTSYRRDLEQGEKLIKPIAQNALLLTFHLIEAVLAKDDLHVNKHQLLPRFLRTDPRIRIFSREERLRLADLFQEMELIRPARVYGGKGDGDALAKLKEVVEGVEEICLKYLEVGR